MITQGVKFLSRVVRTIWHCLRVAAVFLGAEALVDATDGASAPHVWPAHPLCAIFSHCTLHIYALLSPEAVLVTFNGYP
jgi:hypothetical protein